MLKDLEYTLKGLRAPFFKFFNRDKKYFECPICKYKGPFKDKNGRLHAKCPKCGELERARLQYLVLQELLSDFDSQSKSILHLAPENAFRKFFKKGFKNYTCGDLYRSDVDKNFDIQDIPFDDASFDFVFASHVLEYPVDDIKAISEFRRVLKPGGIAVLPVPLLYKKTVDLPERDQLTRMMHEPGLDYFQRYERFFQKVKLFDAQEYPEKYQTLIYQGESGAACPLPVSGGRCSDIVPVCYV